jgi:hypothetical protein
MQPDGLVVAAVHKRGLRVRLADRKGSRALAVARDGFLWPGVNRRLVAIIWPGGRALLNWAVHMLSPQIKTEFVLLPYPGFLSLRDILRVIEV